MSIRNASTTENALDTAYQIAAPQRFDVLSGSLRTAYEDDANLAPFSDLLHALDAIDLPPRT